MSAKEPSEFTPIFDAMQDSGMMDPADRQEVVDIIDEFDTPGVWMVLVEPEARRQFTRLIGIGRVVPLVSIQVYHPHGLPTPVFRMDMQRLPLDDLKSMQRRIADAEGVALEVIEREWGDGASLTVPIGVGVVMVIPDAGKDDMEVYVPY